MIHTPRAQRGMVTSPHHLASQAGLDVLKDGGTAVEAAVAIAATLAVVYPHMTGIGGDGFWLISEPDGRVHAIDACGGAAAGATLALYDGRASVPWRGPLAANTVAGTVGGWAAALAGDSGTLPLGRLVRDAVHYAAAGVAITRGGAEIAAAKGPELRGLDGAFAAIFEPDGRALVEGEILRQPALARTLKAIGRDGARSFYDGELARLVAADLQQLGSPLSAADLATYQTTTPAPLTVATSHARLFNTAPPTQGLAALLIIALFERLPAGDCNSFTHVHGLVEATKLAFAVRDADIGDPAYMTRDAQALLDDHPALAAMARQIDPVRARLWPQPPAVGDTVWFGTADARGQVVSCIQSTYFEFGSGMVLPETGIVWQNRGASFRLAADGWNALKPRRKPFHTLAPALARFDDGRTMAYGTMGGDGQPQTQAAIFSRYARFGMSLQEAITQPRWLLGRTWGEDSASLKIEDRFSHELIDALRAAGHDVELLRAYSGVVGHAGAIVRHPSGLLEGATDPRSDGAVAAW